jgi:hypothetical protein
VKTIPWSVTFPVGAGLVHEAEDLYPEDREDARHQVEDQPPDEGEGERPEDSRRGGGPGGRPAAAPPAGRPERGVHLRPGSDPSGRQPWLRGEDADQARGSFGPSGDGKREVNPPRRRRRRLGEVEAMSRPPRRSEAHRRAAREAAAPDGRTKERHAAVASRVRRHDPRTDRPREAATGPRGSSPPDGVGPGLVRRRPGARARASRCRGRTRPGT